MAYFDNNRSDRGNDRNDRGGERRSFPRPFSDRGRSDRSNFDRPPQLHPATCSKCGKSCMVPFVATGNRPIFCTDCFRTEGGRDAHRSDDRRDGGSSRDNDRRMFDAVCDKCGNRCQVPFQPRDGKEVLCSHCFEQKGKEERGNFEARSRSNDDLSSVNAKLDKILKILESMEIVQVEKEIERPAAPKKAAKETEKVAEVVTKEESEPVLDASPIETEKLAKDQSSSGRKAPAKKKAAPKKKPTPKAE